MSGERAFLAVRLLLNENINSSASQPEALSANSLNESLKNFQRVMMMMIFLEF